MYLHMWMCVIVRPRWSASVGLWRAWTKAWNNFLGRSNGVPRNTKNVSTAFTSEQLTKHFLSSWNMLPVVLSYVYLIFLSVTVCDMLICVTWIAHYATGESFYSISDEFYIIVVSIFFNTKFGAENPPFCGNLGTKLNFWAPIRLLHRKIATSCPPPNFVACDTAGPSNSVTALQRLSLAFLLL